MWLQSSLELPSTAVERSLKKTWFICQRLVSSQKGRLDPSLSVCEKHLSAFLLSFFVLNYLSIHLTIINFHIHSEFDNWQGNWGWFGAPCISEGAGLYCNLKRETDSQAYTLKYSIFVQIRLFLFIEGFSNCCPLYTLLVFLVIVVVFLHCIS